MKVKVTMAIVGVAVFSLLTISLAQQKAQMGQPQQKTPFHTPIAQKAPPPIDPNTLRKIQSPVSRSILIQTLMSNQATRSVIESSARNAKIQVKELPSKGLDGKAVSAAAQGKKIEELNWNAGIKFSLAKYPPKFFDPTVNMEKPLGWMTVDVFLNSVSAFQDFSNDVFLLSGPNSPLIFRLLVPPYVSTYMIAIHGRGSPQSPYEVSLMDSSGSRKLDVLPLSTGESSVAITTISPQYFTKYYGDCSIALKPGAYIYFGGFTITRLQCFLFT